MARITETDVEKIENRVERVQNLFFDFINNDQIKGVSVYESTRKVEWSKRFIAYEDGIVFDSRTGLEWFVGPDKDTICDDAKAWVKNLNLDGGGWRMPTTEELKTLYKKGAGTRNMTPLLKTTGWFVWSGQTSGSSSALYFTFDSGDGL